MCYTDCRTRPCDTIAVQGPAIKLANKFTLKTVKMQIYGVMQSFISYIQEKFNSIACNVRSFLCLCWYQNDDLQSQLDDSGPKTLPLGCICTDEHADKQIKETMQVHVNKQMTTRSRFHLFINSSQPRKICKSRDRALSRIPAMQLKRILQKSRKVRQSLRKHALKIIPKSSKLHESLSRKSHVYHRLTYDLFCITHKCKQSKQSVKYSYGANQCLYLVFVQIRSPKHKKVPVVSYITNMTGLARLKCSRLKALWVLSRIVSLSGDVEKNPGPTNQCNESRNANCLSVANPVSLLESRLSQIGRVAIDVGGAGNCFFRAISHQLFGTPDYHLHVRSQGMQYLLHNPELFIESNTERSWQDYLNDMSREGTWADGIIIQAVANCLNLTINIAESFENFSPLTVIHPVNTQRNSSQVFIGHIGEYHYVSTVNLLNLQCNRQEQVANDYFYKDQQLVYAVRIDAEQAKAKQKACEKDYIQSERRNTAHTEMDNEQAREKQKTRKRHYIRKKRLDTAYTEIENIKRRKTQPISEADKNTKRKAYMKQLMQKKQANAEFRRKENKRKRDKAKLRKGNTNTNTCNATAKKMSTDNNNDTSNKIIDQFHKNIRCGPEYICTCCDQLWYRSSVTKCNVNNYSKCPQKLVKSCITGLKSVDDTEWICSTCHSNLKESKIPQCSKANGMIFPKKPAVLDLTPLEERLVSPRIPFMQIRELPRGGQLLIHGNVVNVPSDVNSTVHTLPRSISESQTIPIKLKRSLSYKHHYQFQNVRPMKVLEAAKYLVSTSELFKSEGIEVQDSWQNYNTSHVSEQQDWQEFFQGHDNYKTSSKNDEDQGSNTASNIIDIGTNMSSEPESNENDSWCEVQERPSGVTDTLLQEPDICENSDKILSFAPGEGNKPLGIFMDKDSEFLSFPTIFCGKRRTDNKVIQYCC